MNQKHIRLNEHIILPYIVTGFDSTIRNKAGSKRVIKSLISHPYIHCRSLHGRIQTVHG